MDLLSTMHQCVINSPQPSSMFMMTTDDDDWRWQLMMMTDDDDWWWWLMMMTDDNDWWWWLMMMTDDDAWWWLGHNQGRTHRQTTLVVKLLLRLKTSHLRLWMVVVHWNCSIIFLKGEGGLAPIQTFLSNFWGFLLNQREKHWKSSKSSRNEKKIPNFFWGSDPGDLEKFQTFLGLFLLKDSLTLRNLINWVSNMKSPQNLF